MIRVAMAVASLAVLFACKSAPKPFPEPTQVAAAPVRADFKPPLAQEIVERSVTSRAEQVVGGSNVEESVTATLQSSFEKLEDGYRLTQVMPEVIVVRNGQRVENPLVQFVTKLPIIVKLAPDGSFVELMNPQDVERVIRESFPQQQADAILKYFASNALEAQARREWNAKYGAFLGRDVAPGFAWYAVESIATNVGQEVPFVLERKVRGVRQGERGRELVIDFACPTSPSTAANPDAMQATLEEQGGPALDPSLSCRGEQIVALDPFLPVSSTLEVTANATLETGAKANLLFMRTVRTEQPAVTEGKEGS